MSGVDVDGNVYAISLDKVINKVTMETIPTVAAISDYYDNDYAVVIRDIVFNFQKGKGRNVDIDVDYLAADLSEQYRLEFLGEELYAEIEQEFDSFVTLPYLRKQIIEQAKNMGIPSEALEFP